MARQLRHALAERLARAPRALTRAGTALLWAVFLVWYLAALAFFPQPWLWWTATASALALTGIGVRWPHATIWWLPWCVMVWPMLARWLPWPHVKFTYLGAASMCAAYGLRHLWRRKRVAVRCGPLAWYVLFCCGWAVVLGIVACWLAQEPAAARDFVQDLRLAPLVSERDAFPGLRYAWMWALACASLPALRSILRTRRDVHALLWSMQLATAVIFVIGLYSYRSGQWMVDYYVYDRRINATFGSPAVLADVMTVTLLCGAYLLYESRHWLTRMVLAILMAGQMTCIVLSGCRANIIVLGVCGAAWSVGHIRQHWQAQRWHSLRRSGKCLAMLVVLGLLALGVCAVLPAAWLQQIPGVRRWGDWRGALGSLQQLRYIVLIGRWDHWQCALNMLQSAPLWGIGVGLFESNYLDFRTGDDLFQLARAHNVFLRIGAEGGLMLVSAVLVMLIGGVRALRPAWLAGYVHPGDDWARTTRALCMVLLALGVTALTSDVLFENSEAIMVLLLIVAGAATACVRCGAAQQARGAWRERLHALDTWVQHRIRQRGWGVALHVRARRWLWGGLAVLTLLSAWCGWGAARSRCARAFQHGKLAYGFRTLTQVGLGGARWNSVGTHAMLMVQPRKPIMVLQCRAVHARAALANKRVTLYLNGELLAVVPLRGTELTTIYCDCTGIREMSLALAVRTQHAFVPWREGWYDDPFPSSVQLTKPGWLSAQPSNTIAGASGIWNVHWSAYPQWYRAQGYTNHWVVY
jgi:hypothetical protein